MFNLRLGSVRPTWSRAPALGAFSFQLWPF